MYVVSAAASAADLDKCAWGESYWCSDLQAAKTCGAFKHCMSTIWKNQQLTQVCQQISLVITRIDMVASLNLVTDRQKRLIYSYPLPTARQHPSYGDCLEVKREYYQNCSVLDCVTQCSQFAAHLYEQFLQVKQIGFVTLGPLRCV